MHIYLHLCCAWMALLKYLCVSLAASSLTYHWVNVYVDAMLIRADIIQVQMYLCPCLHVNISLLFCQPHLFFHIYDHLNILCLTSIFVFANAYGVLNAIQ